jgi:aryl-alcohol dehydrogenase-like predicted oxidoreductase
VSLVKLSNCGLRVSKISLGTMTFGHPEYGCDQTEAGKIVDAYLGAGHNFIDTADIYAKGDSETILGNLLGARRKDTIIATKGFWAVEDGPNRCGASRKHLIEACEASLRRLKTDYIDLYYVHIWDPLTPLEETLGALNTLVEQGKVRYIGASDYAGWQINEAVNVSKSHNWHKYVVHQVEYSALARDIEIEIVPATTYHGLGIIGWSPLAGGMLSGKYDGSKDSAGRFNSGDAGKWWGERFGSDANYHGAVEFTTIAREIGASPVSLAVAFTLKPEWMTSTIIGVRTVAQLEANLAAESLSLSEELYQRLLAIKPPYRPFPLPMHDNARKLRTKQDYTN